MTAVNYNKPSSLYNVFFSNFCYILVKLKSSLVNQFTPVIRRHCPIIHLILSINSNLETCVQAFDSIREFRNGKRYNTARTTTMSENRRSEGSHAMNSNEINENDVPEFRSLTQEEVNEKIKSFIMRHLRDLTRLVQGM